MPEYTSPSHSLYTTTAASEDKFPYVSTADRGAGEVGDAFLELCIDDEECSRYFKSGRLSASLRHLIEKFDKAPNSTYAELVSTKGVQSANKPSFSLRGTLGWMLIDSTWRTFIPPLVYRPTHCTKGDRLVLTQLLTSLKSFAEARTQDNAYTSMLMYDLIIVSELWEKPAPSFRLLEKRLTDAKL